MPNLLTVNRGHPLVTGYQLKNWWLSLPYNSGGGMVQDIYNGQHFPSNGSLTPKPCFGPHPNVMGWACDGSTTYIQQSFRAPTFPLAISCWVRTASTAATFRTIFGFTSTASNSRYTVLQMTNNANGRVNYGMQGTVAVSTLSSTSGVNDGKWHHVLGVSLASNNHRIYIDGRFENSSAINVGTLQSDLLNIGRVTLINVGSQYFPGQIADCAYWGVGLYASAGVNVGGVTALYDQGRRGYPGMLYRTPRRFSAPIAAAGAALENGWQAEHPHTYDDRRIMVPY